MCPETTGGDGCYVHVCSYTALWTPIVNVYQIDGSPQHKPHAIFSIAKLIGSMHGIFTYIYHKNQPFM